MALMYSKGNIFVFGGFDGTLSDTDSTFLYKTIEEVESDLIEPKFFVPK